jgi:hypothetical protein
MKYNNKGKNFWILSEKYYSFGKEEKFNEYFFPIENKEWNEFPYTINIYGIQDTNIPSPSANELNLLLCVENCKAHTHYKHHNKYNDFNDDNIQVYFYNHIDTIIKDKTYIAIPLIFIRINHFYKRYREIYPTTNIPFDKKKCCVILTPNFHNMKIKNTLYHLMNKIDKCYNINDFKMILGNKSCYHSQEFLNFIQHFKFCIVCENSFNDGYITEKIFNCFFGRTIPIYCGKGIEKYIHETSFVNVNDYLDDSNNFFSLNTLYDYLYKLNNNKVLYNQVIQSPKCKNVPKYECELNNFIKTIK